MRALKESARQDYFDGSKPPSSKEHSTLRYPRIGAIGQKLRAARVTLVLGLIEDHQMEPSRKDTNPPLSVQAATIEGRQAFQLELADRIRRLTRPDEVTAVASELLGRYLQAQRVVYGRVDDSYEFLSLSSDWTDGTLMLMGGMKLTLNDFGKLIVDEVRAGHIVAVDDVTTNTNSAPYAETYLATGIRSFLAIPQMQNGGLRAILSVHISTVHHWTTDEIALAEDVVDRTWFAVQSALAQAELREERDQSQQIFDSMTDGFVLFDANFKFLRLNAMGARIGRHTREEMLGRILWEIRPDLIGGPLHAMYLRTQSTQVAEILEFEYPFPTDGGTWLEVRAYPLPERRLAVFFIDISARKNVEQQLTDANRRKDEFLAMLAHELRNPLAPISAASHLLQGIDLDDIRVRQTSQVIARQVEHLTHLIDDLLDVSRVTSGLVKLEIALVQVEQVVTEAVEQVAPFIQSRGHNLALDLSPDARFVMGDSKRLVQIISNLLNNAAKYTAEGGRIALTTAVREANVIIEVSDNGIGMEPDMVAHAFDLFAQAERNSDRSLGGLGLGLALVKNLVELHNGTVCCESAGIHEGSKFTVCLPRVVTDGSLGRIDEAIGTEASSSLRIMVVDDNVDAAEMLAMLLKMSGHYVMMEHTPRLALARARQEAPQVCLLDIGLPEMDGSQLAQELRALPEMAKSVMIAVTGYDQHSEGAPTGNFDHYLVKPIDWKRLESILGEIEEGPPLP